MLYGVSGVGRVQHKGEKVQVLQPGDTVQIRPGGLHWPGAAPDRLFAHITMSENTDTGESTAWFEKVTDEEYAIIRRRSTR